jgi:hypothetical protein
VAVLLFKLKKYSLNIKTMKRYTFSDTPVIEKYGIEMLEIRNAENKICGYSEIAFDVHEKCFLAESTETFIFKESEIRGGLIRGLIRGGEIDFTLTLIQIQGTKHFVSVDYFGTPMIKLNIGCHSRTITDWLENFENVGKKNGYSAAQIAEYKRYIDLFNEMYWQI